MEKKKSENNSRPRERKGVERRVTKRKRKRKKREVRCLLSE